MKFTPSMEHEARTLRAACEMMVKLREVPDPNFEFRMNIYTSSPRIVVNSLDAIKQCRRWLADAFGWTKYELKQRFYSCGFALTTWESDHKPSLEMWLECHVDDYPTELQGEHCLWEKTRTKEQEDYVFVCKTESDSGEGGK